MLRRIGVLLLSAMVMVTLVASLALAAPRDNLEEKETGKPDDPNSWGSVSSQIADEGVMGEHSSDPIPFVEGHETPRDGLGNVAKNDAFDHGVTGPCEDGETPTVDNCDSGSQLSDHGCVAAAAPLPGIVDEDGNPIQPDCTLDPQEIHGPEPEPES